MTNSNNIECLDKGYVKLVDHMGSDLSFVNAARASFAKESDSLQESDIRLLRFLINEDHMCYDDQTEVFTSAGWVLWPSITPEMQLAAVSEDGIFHFEHASAVHVYDHDGPMYKASHRDADFCVTLNHRMWVSRRGNQGFKPFEITDAGDLLGKSYRIQSSAVNYSGEGGTYDEGFLYGFFLGDGSRSSTNRIKFHLRKQRKIDALTTTLDNLGLEYTFLQKDEDEKITTLITVPTEQHPDFLFFVGEAHSKSISESAFAKSFQYRQGVFDGLLSSDGSVKRKAYTFGSTSKELIESFQRLGVTVGKYIKLGKPKNGFYRAMVLSRSTSPRINDPGISNDAIVDYQGKVYCATVSTGLVLVRRNGCVMVSGNSPFRHAFLTFEFKAPLMVARQHWKYVVGSDHTLDSWNESCFPGDQEVVAFPYASGTRKRYLVHELYELAQKNNSYLPRVPSVGTDGTIIPNKIKDVWLVGEAEVFEVQVNTGVKIRTTSNHRYLTPNGYRELRELSVGDAIMGNGVPAYKSSEWLSDQYITQAKTQDEIAQMAGCSTHTIRKWVRIHKLQQNQVARMQSFNRIHGVFGKGLNSSTSDVIAERSAKSGATQKGKPKARGEQNGNFKFDDVKDPTTGRYRARRAWNSSPLCEICGDVAQLHHVDENPLNNSVDNLVPLCQGHHDIAHGKAPLLVPHPVVITSIESVGVMPVYDIEMTDEPNLVVSNLVVHNSRRYVTQEPEFYIPAGDAWRSAPENKKQGSGPAIDTEAGAEWTQQLEQYCALGENRYKAAMEAGIAAEQARLFLPAYGMYVNYRWSCSFQSMMLFLSQRLEHDSQYEIQVYAKAVYELVKNLYPISIDLFLGGEKA